MDTSAAHRTHVSGPELRGERELADLTQTQVGEAMGVTPSAVSRYEGQVRVKPGVARRFRDAIARLSSESAA